MRRDDRRIARLAVGLMLFAVIVFAGTAKPHLVSDAEIVYADRDGYWVVGVQLEQAGDHDEYACVASLDALKGPYHACETLRTGQTETMIDGWLEDHNQVIAGAVVIVDGLDDPEPEMSENLVEIRMQPKCEECEICEECPDCPTCPECPACPEPPRCPDGSQTVCVTPLE